MSIIELTVAIAIAIALGTVLSYIIAMKLLSSRKGKRAVRDWAAEINNLTYDLIKDQLKDTKKWTELFNEVTEKSLENVDTSKWRFTSDSDN